MKFSKHVKNVQEQNFGQRQKTALAAKLSSVGGMKGRQQQQGGSTNRQQQQGPESIGSSALERVLVLPISESQGEMPGLAGEDAVLSKSREVGGPSSSTGSRVRMNMSGLEVEGSLTSASGEVQEKRTRFSLSHDEQGSTTSDNLEAISEVASNHSVASSLEDEVDPVEDPIIDNLSDMVSANVSGRGTPNVSGRDTPSSQVTEGEGEERGKGRRWGRVITTAIISSAILAQDSGPPPCFEGPISAPAPPRHGATADDARPLPSRAALPAYQHRRQRE